MTETFINFPPGGGGSGGSDPLGSYAVVSGTNAPASARVLTAGANVSLIDTGTTLIISASATTGPTGPTGSAGAPGGADINASYLVIANTSSLPNERALAAGTGISFSDGGAGGALTVNATFPFTSFYTMTASYVIDSRAGITDNTLFMTTTATMTASLPAATSGRTIVFKDIIGSASTYPCNIAPTGGAKIDTVSASYHHYSNFGTLKLFSNGTDWFTW